MTLRNSSLLRRQSAHLPPEVWRANLPREVCTRLLQLYAQRTRTRKLINRNADWNGSVYRNVNRWNNSWLLQTNPIHGLITGRSLYWSLVSSLCYHTGRSSVLPYWSLVCLLCYHTSHCQVRCVIILVTGGFSVSFYWAMVGPLCHHSGHWWVLCHSTCHLLVLCVIILVTGGSSVSCWSLVGPGCHHASHWWVPCHHTGHWWVFYIIILVTCM